MNRSKYVITFFIILFLLVFAGFLTYNFINHLMITNMVSFSEGKMAHDSEYKKESNFFDFVYTIRFHKNTSDPNYDQLTYTILITNTTAEKISNLKVNFNFHDNMTKYLTEPRFLTAPIELEKENSDPTDKRNSYEFIKSVSVVKPESLDVSEQELMKRYYHYLYIDFIWDHGEEHILLDKSQLDDVPL